jgi:hypothetical protein
VYGIACDVCMMTAAWIETCMMVFIVLIRDRFPLLREEHVLLPSLSLAFPSSLFSFDRECSKLIIRESKIKKDMRPDRDVAFN